MVYTIVTTLHHTLDRDKSPISLCTFFSWPPIHSSEVVCLLPIIKHSKPTHPAGPMLVITSGSCSDVYARFSHPLSDIIFLISSLSYWEKESHFNLTSHAAVIIPGKGLLQCPKSREGSEMTVENGRVRASHNLVTSVRWLTWFYTLENVPLAIFIVSQQLPSRADIVALHPCRSSAVLSVLLIVAQVRLINHRRLHRTF